ncbi:hypothetical protein BJ878DRAFT_420739 [Calycina marina]|uniref:Uncharacterized protein n=1 Tax=Calycina marina TaxID=1763456 RepID=A0A9P8CGS0_9HELO|nr:hypothetical protein BJ878DRAFT_420739 [Calycina marina]
MIAADQPRRKPMPSYLPAQPQHPNIYGHSRQRTTSSSIFPTIVLPHQHQQQQHPQNQQHNNMQVHSYTSRRTPSQGTFSTINSNGNGPFPVRQGSQDLRRSTSSRSAGGSPTSYVALMRKQKATVWCDRSQQEDPRTLAAQKAAKIRAAREVIGGRTPGRTSTSGSASLAGSSRVTAKIKHHGKAGLVGYSPGDLVGGVGGVPLRLSASEVEGDDADDDADSQRMQYNHHRTGSGRSSIGSGKRGLTYSRKSGASSMAGKWSSGHSPQESLRDLAEAGETPIPGGKQQQEYFATDGSGDGTRSAGSGSSGERADNVGDMDTTNAARLASNSLLKSTVTREKSVRNPDELRRRGSVDERTERTMTMSHGRLYIANPDTDSD